MRLHVGAFCCVAWRKDTRNVASTVPASTNPAPARCAIAAMMLIVASLLIDVVLQLLPPHYSVVSDAENDLAVGPSGGMMSLNFATRGVMSGLLVVALWQGAPRQGREASFVD